MPANVKYSKLRHDRYLRRKIPVPVNGTMWRSKVNNTIVKVDQVYVACTDKLRVEMREVGKDGRVKANYYGYQTLDAEQFMRTFEPAYD